MNLLYKENGINGKKRNLKAPMTDYINRLNTKVKAFTIILLQFRFYAK